MKGKVQVINACICIEVIKIIENNGYKVELPNMLNGLKTVIHRGRMEQLNSTPEIFFDGAHNEPAIKNLLDMVDMYFPSKKRVYIISILSRKDYKKILSVLSKDKNAIFILTSGTDEKYTTNDELYECMSKYVEEGKIYKDSIENAINNAMINEDDNTVYFVVGSFYTYGTVTQKIEELKKDIVF